MIYKNKKAIENQLLDSFGKIKDEAFNFEEIKRYSDNKNNLDAFQILSEKTCNDLDFQELFMFIDRTCSKPGQQYLFNKLRTIPNKIGHPGLKEKIINQLLNSREVRLSIQMQLKRLAKQDAYYISSLFQEKHISRPKWFFILPVLSFASVLSLIAGFVNPAFILLFAALFIVNLIFHYWNKHNLYPYLASIPQLLILNNVTREIVKIKELTSINPEIQKSIKIIDKIRNRMSFFQLEAKLQGDMEAIFWGILEMLKIAFLIEPLLLFGVLKLLNNKREEIEELFVFVGEVDSLQSIASLRQGIKKFAVPEISSEKSIFATNIYHPLIPDCVENNISVNNRSVLLTGSNMSGKTSFIRTIGINVLTGLTLNTCFAEKFKMPKMKIFSAIRISDDLLNDKSYYFEEVLTIKEMIDKSQSETFNLFLLDEIFKGTNTVERISAGKAVLSELTRENNLVFVSTHDIELADLLKSEYELFHFSETVNNKMVDFDYKLKEGKLKNRNAIKILEINHYPSHVINEAIKISKELDYNYETKPK